MAIAAIFGVLSGIVALLNQPNIPNTASLCVNYTTLATDKDTIAVLTNTSAVSLLNGTTIPQLCTNLQTEFKEMSPYMFMYLKLVNPFMSLPGFQVIQDIKTLNDILQMLLPVHDQIKDMSPSDPNLLPVMMQPDVLNVLVKIKTYVDVLLKNESKLEKLEDEIVYIVRAAIKLPAVCMSANFTGLVYAPNLLGLLNGSSIMTLCGTTALDDLGVTVAEFANMTGMMELSAELPLILTLLKVLKPIATLSGLDRQIVGLVKALATLEKISSTDPMIFLKMMEPSVRKVLRSMKGPKIAEFFTQLIPTIGELLAVCSTQNPALALPQASANLQQLLTTVEATSFCANDTLVGPLRRDLSEFIKMSVGKNKEMEGMKTQVPQILLTLKLLKPFVDLPGFNQHLRALSLILNVLNGMSNDPTNLILTMMRPDVQGALMDIMKPGTQAAFSGILTVSMNIGSVCANPSKHSNDPALQGLFNQSSIAEFCSNTNITDIGVTVGAFFNMIGINVEGLSKMKAKLPELLLTLKVLKTVVRLPGFNPKIRALVQGLAPLEGLGSTHESVIAVVMQPGVGAALMGMEGPNVETALTLQIAAVGGLVAVCNSQDPAAALSSYPNVQSLLGGTAVDTFCSNTELTDLRRDLGALIRKSTTGTGGKKEKEQNEKELAKLTKKIPQLLLTLKVLKPFVKLPGVSSAVRTLVNALAPLNGMSSNDPNLFLALMQPKVLAALMSMDKADAQAAFTGVFEGIGAIPTICTDPTVAEGITQLLKLIKSTRMVTVCGYVKVTVLAKNLHKLQQMEIANKGVVDHKKVFPQLALALKVLTPFMDLPGFDDTLRAHMVTLQTVVSLKVNSAAFNQAFQDSNVLAAAGAMATPGMQKYFAEVFKGVGVMVGVCPTVKHFKSFRKLLQGKTVKDICDNSGRLDVLGRDLVRLHQMSQPTSLAIPSFRRSFVESVVYHIVLVALVKLIV